MVTQGGRSAPLELDALVPATQVDRSDPERRAWIDRAIRAIDADATRSADTHLLRLPCTDHLGVHVYLKDESVHPTGSLKHRLARSLILYALVNGWIGPDTTLVEASSGSTAISEAYFARLIGVPFVTVVPRSTSAAKIALIEREGGACHLVDRADEVYDAARRLAASVGGHYLDQFTYAERATDWRSNNNIAESIFEQLRSEPHPVPEWIVVGAGTGGTSATIGRYVRYRGFHTSLAVVDPESSAFYDSYRDGCDAVAAGSRIEGIGRPRVEPSFVPTVVERMIRVPDAASVAAARFVRDLVGRDVGPSTGTNIWGVMELAAELCARGRTGSIVTLICDSGDRYSSTYGDDAWVAELGWELAPYRAALQRFVDSGEWYRAPSA